jgi:hypothetical protein
VGLRDRLIASEGLARARCGWDGECVCILGEWERVWEKDVGKPGSEGTSGEAEAEAGAGADVDMGVPMTVLVLVRGEAAGISGCGAVGSGVGYRWVVWGCSA